MKSKIKKKIIKSKSKPKPRPKSKPKNKVKYVLRVRPVSKTYRIVNQIDPQDSSKHGIICAYEDGLEICKLDCEHQRAFDNAIFHLKALLYKEIK